MGIQNEKCVICSKKICRDKKNLLKSVCSAVRKMMHLEANVIEIVPESVINNILHEQPINNILHEQPQKSYLPTQQQVEELVKYKNRKLVIPWSYILEPEKEYAKNLKMPGILIFSFLSSRGCSSTIGNFRVTKIL